VVSKTIYENGEYELIKKKLPFLRQIKIEDYIGVSPEKKRNYKKFL